VVPDTILSRTTTDRLDAGYVEILRRPADGSG
jgi:hypothetical protein